MSTSIPDPDDADRFVDHIEATAETFDVGGEWITLITDPMNDRAWVQSDTTLPIKR